jgi:ribosomal protein L7/L12
MGIFDFLKSNKPTASDTSEPTDATVEDFVRRGQTIEAIKLYREQHSVGLKEAKDAVDAMERRLKGR